MTMANGAARWARYATSKARVGGSESCPFVVSDMVVIAEHALDVRKRGCAVALAEERHSYPVVADVPQARAMELGAGRRRAALLEALATKDRAALRGFERHRGLLAAAGANGARFYLAVAAAAA